MLVWQHLEPGHQQTSHDDIIKWRHLLRYWPFVRGIHRWPVNSPHKGQWRGALMFPLICAWTNDWANHRDTGVLRCHRTHYDVTVMITLVCSGTYILILHRKSHLDVFNLMRLSGAYMCQWNGSALVMACHLFSAKPLPEPMLVYCQSNSWEQVSEKFESEFYYFHSRKCMWKYCLPKWRPVCPGGDELTHWGWVMHIFVSKLNIIASDNGLSPDRQ